MAAFLSTAKSLETLTQAMGNCIPSQKVLKIQNTTGVFIISSLTLWGRLVSTGRRIAVIAVAIVLILTQHPGVEFKCRPLLCHALCLSICYLQRLPILQDVKTEPHFLKLFQSSSPFPPLLLSSCLSFLLDNLGKART